MSATRNGPHRDATRHLSVMMVNFYGSLRYTLDRPRYDHEVPKDTKTDRASAIGDIRPWCVSKTVRAKPITRQPARNDANQFLPQTR